MMLFNFPRRDPSLSRISDNSSIRTVSSRPTSPILPQVSLSISSSATTILQLPPASQLNGPVPLTVPTNLKSTPSSLSLSSPILQLASQSKEQTAHNTGPLTDIIRPSNTITKLMLLTLDAQNVALKSENARLKDSNRRLSLRIDVLDRNLLRTSRELEAQRTVNVTQAYALNDAKTRIVKLEEVATINTRCSERREERDEEPLGFTSPVTCFFDCHDDSLEITSTTEPRLSLHTSSPTDSFESVDEMLSTLRWSNAKSYQSWESKLSALGIHRSTTFDKPSENTMSVDLVDNSVVHASNVRNNSDGIKDNHIAHGLREGDEALSTSNDPTENETNAGTSTQMETPGIHLVDQHLLHEWRPRPRCSHLESTTTNQKENASPSASQSVVEGRTNFTHSTRVNIARLKIIRRSATAENIRVPPVSMGNKPLYGKTPANSHIHPSKSAAVHPPLSSRSLNTVPRQLHA